MKLRIVFLAYFVLVFSSMVSTAAQLQPATVPSITPEAKHLLDQVRDAYASLKFITITGQSHGHFDIDGLKHDASASFTGSWLNGKFKNETVGDALIGNTGQHLYLYMPSHNSYLLRESSDEKVNLETIDPDLADILRNQDLSLALAVSGDAEIELTNGATVIDTDPQPLGAQRSPMLRIVRKTCTLTLTIDPQSHLIGREEVDYTQLARQRGATAVESASYAVDFTNTTTSTPDESSFRWSPPPGSHEAHQDGPTIVGKPAPSFKLPGLDGQAVSMTQFKGSLAVIDLWAAAYRPSVESLLQLDQLSKDFTTAGVKFLAVSVDDANAHDALLKFVAQNHLSIPVALDPEGKLLEAYGLQAIPSTIVIGKDGKVRKVFVGPGQEKDIHDEIEAASSAR